MGYAWEAGDVRGDAGPLLGRLLTSPTYWGARSLAEWVSSYANALDWTFRC
jgi:hypothetical protein